jgi:hypothetical protein
MAASEKSADLKNMMVEVLSKCAVDIKGSRTLSFYIPCRTSETPRCPPFKAHNRWVTRQARREYLPVPDTNSFGSPIARRGTRSSLATPSLPRRDLDEVASPSVALVAVNERAKACRQPSFLFGLQRSLKLDLAVDSTGAKVQIAPMLQ